MVRSTSSCRPSLVAALCVAGLASWSAAAKSAMAVSSPAFAADQSIPAEFSCDGANRSPPLRWTDPPAGTRSFAVIVEDPDAPSGTFRHWGLYDLPPDRRQLESGDGNRQSLHQARNDFGKIGYSGPCPPRGQGAHRYRFRLLALNVPRLQLGTPATMTQLLQQAGAHTLATAVLTSRYQRR